MGEKKESIIDRMDAEWDALPKEEQDRRLKAWDEAGKERDRKAAACAADMKKYIIENSGKPFEAEQLHELFKDRYERSVCYDATGVLESDEDLYRHIWNEPLPEVNIPDRIAVFKHGDPITDEELSYWFF
jgi:hypothetical protein